MPWTTTKQAVSKSEPTTATSKKTWTRLALRRIRWVGRSIYKLIKTLSLAIRELFIQPNKTNPWSWRRKRSTSKDFCQLPWQKKSAAWLARWGWSNRSIRASKLTARYQFKAYSKSSTRLILNSIWINQPHHKVTFAQKDKRNKTNLKWWWIRSNLSFFSTKNSQAAILPMSKTHLTRKSQNWEERRTKWTTRAL